jgi:SAM-dependent methyltransferase
MAKSYLETVLEAIQADPEISEAFGRNLHFGFWEDPSQADPSIAGFAAAAESMSRRVCDVIGVADGQCLLDVGCGLGGTLASINERFSSMHLVGVNVDARQAVQARQDVKARQGNRLAFSVGDACNLSFPDRTFDAVMAVECIFHFSSRLRFMKEARRVLKPGGRLLISDLVPGWRTALAVLPRSLLLSRSRMRTYGLGQRLPCTMAGYRRCGRWAKLTLEQDVDITGNTVPTYSAIRGLIGHADPPHRGAIDFLEWTTRRRMITYRILVFRA